MKHFHTTIFLLLVSISVKAQTLQAGVYSGGRYYIPDQYVWQSLRANRWDNDVFLRWEPKGKISFETTFTTFERTDYNEIEYGLEYPYWGEILEKEKAIYSEYLFSFRAQYHFFHSPKNRFNCFAGISYIVNFEDYITSSWYYHEPDTMSLITATRDRNKFAGSVAGVNVEASYQINKHLVLRALWEYRIPIIGINFTNTKITSIGDPILYTHYGGKVMTYQLGISYSFKY